jgi:NADPH2:quinone reductase
MKAMVVVQGKEGGRLELQNVPKPKPLSGQLLVRVKATSVNRADLYQVQGTYDPTKPPAVDSVEMAGLEAAGEVAGMGTDVSGFSIGDRVMCYCSGGYAEFITVDHHMAMPIPTQLDWEQAASVPLAYMTQYNALVMEARLKPGESVLIHGAAAGVGVAAIQIAKLFGAKPIMGTDSPAAKLKAVADLGLDVGIDYRTESFVEKVQVATNGKGADVIIDHVGAPYLGNNLRSMAVKGRLISVGRLAGGKAEIDLDLLALKRLEVIGVTFRTRTLDEKISIVRGVTADLIPALADGRLKPVIDRVFRLDQAREAQAYMTSNAQIGKIVLKI